MNSIEPKSLAVEFRGGNWSLSIKLPSNKSDFARRHARNSFVECWNDVLKGFRRLILDAHHDNSDWAARDLLLICQIAVERYQNVEAPLHRVKKRAIGKVNEAGEMGCLPLSTRQMLSQPMRDAGV